MMTLLTQVDVRFGGARLAVAHLAPGEAVELDELVLGLGLAIRVEACEGRAVVLASSAAVATAAAPWRLGRGEIEVVVSLVPDLPLAAARPRAPASILPWLVVALPALLVGSFALGLERLGPPVPRAEPDLNHPLVARLVRLRALEPAPLPLPPTVVGTQNADIARMAVSGRVRGRAERSRPAPTPAVTAVASDAASRDEARLEPSATSPSSASRAASVAPARPEGDATAVVVPEPRGTGDVSPAVGAAVAATTNAVAGSSGAEVATAPTMRRNVSSLMQCYDRFPQADQRAALARCLDEARVALARIPSDELPEASSLPLAFARGPVVSFSIEVARDGRAHVAHAGGAIALDAPR